MSFFHLFLVGTLIGTAMIIPGVSGGVLAVIFNVYDKMIYSLTNLFKDFKKHFIFLAVLGLGIGLGAIWFSRVMMFLYQNYEVITKFSFIGLILGGVPYLLQEIKSKAGKNINYIAMTVTLFFSLILWLISNNIFHIDLDGSNNSLLFMFFNLFLAGVIYAVGKVIPGISGSFLLIMIGMYEYVLSVVSNPLAITLDDFFKLVPFVLGLIVGIILLLKLMNYLLKNNFRTTYSVIVGFVIGSIPALVPSLNFNIELIKGVIIMLFCFILSYKISK